MSRELDPSGLAENEAHSRLEMAEDSRDSSASVHSSVPSVGQQLRLSREGRGLSVGDVSRALKLSFRQVEAIEADDWPNLPCNTILRGFVRNYARLLELNPDGLMATLDGLQMHKTPDLQIASGTPVSIPQEGRADRRDYARVLSGLIILLLAVAAYFLVPSDLLRSTLITVTNAIQWNTDDQGNVVAPIVNETKEATAVESVIAAEPLAVVEVFPSVSDSSASTEPVAEAATPVPPVSATNVLKFSFAQPSWVEVRDRNGQVIFSQLSQAGSQRDVEGFPPFSLVVGNAAHVSLQYKGKAVDLSKRSKDDVARLSLE